MLPSGRKVAVDPSPFWRLLDGIDSPVNAHKIMAIRDWSGVLPWIDVLLLFDETDATAEIRRKAAEDGIHAVPHGMLGIRSGYRLDRWRDLAAEGKWSVDDVRAMEVFVDDSVHHQFERLVDKAAEAQRLLRENPQTDAGIFEAMWAQGVHPLQDQPPVNRRVLDSDSYDRLAALVWITGLLMTDSALGSEHANALTRLRGVLPRILDTVGYPPEAETSTIRAAADWWRALDPLARLPDQERDWFHRQIAAECSVLWEQTGDELRTAAPDAYELVELAALAGDPGRTESA